MLQVNKAYNENDIVLMRSKLNIILKLYLISDLPPKLRVRGDPFLHKTLRLNHWAPHSKTTGNCLWRGGVLGDAKGQQKSFPLPVASNSDMLPPRG